MKKQNDTPHQNDLLSVYQTIDYNYFTNTKMETFGGLYLQSPAPGSGKTSSAEKTIEKLLNEPQKLKEMYAHYGLPYPETGPKFIYLSTQKNLTGDILLKNSNASVHNLSSQDEVFQNQLETIYDNSISDFKKEATSVFCEMLGLDDLIENGGTQKKSLCAYYRRFKLMQYQEMDHKGEEINKQKENYFKELHSEILKSIESLLDEFQVLMKFNEFNTLSSTRLEKEKETFQIQKAQFQKRLKELFSGFLKYWDKTIRTKKPIQPNESEIVYEEFVFEALKKRYFHFLKGHKILDFYPGMLASQQDVLTMTYSKFIYSNFDPLYDYCSILEAPYIKNTILVCDEIDAFYTILKDSILNSIAKPKLNYNALLTEIHKILSSVDDLYNDKKKKELHIQGRFYNREKGDYQVVENVWDFLKNEYENLCSKYNPSYSYVIPNDLMQGSNFFYQNAIGSYSFSSSKKIKKITLDSKNCTYLFGENKQTEKEENTDRNIYSYYEELTNYFQTFSRMFLHHIFPYYLFYYVEEFRKQRHIYEQELKKVTLSSLIQLGKLNKKKAVKYLKNCLIYFNFCVNTKELEETVFYQAMKLRLESYFEIDYRKVSQEESFPIRYRRMYFDLYNLISDNQLEGVITNTIQLYPYQMYLCPEDILVKLCSKCRVLGMSATAFVGGIKNFDMEWVREWTPLYDISKEEEELEKAYLSTKWKQESQIDYRFQDIYVDDHFFDEETPKKNFEKLALHYIKNEIKIDYHHNRFALELARKYMTFVRSYVSFRDSGLPAMLIYNNYLPKESENRNDVVCISHLKTLMELLNRYLHFSNTEHLLVFSANDLKNNKVQKTIEIPHKNQQPLVLMTTYQSAGLGTNALVLKKEPYEQSDILQINDFGFDLSHVDIPCICCNEVTNFLPMEPKEYKKTYEEVKWELEIIQAIHTLCMKKEIPYSDMQGLITSILNPSQDQRRSVKDTFSNAWYQFRNISQAVGRLDRTSNKYKKQLYMTATHLKFPKKLIEQVPFVAKTKPIRFLLSQLEEPHAKTDTWDYYRLNRSALDFKQKMVPFPNNPLYRKDPRQYIKEYKELVAYFHGHFVLTEEEYQKVPRKYRRYYIKVEPELSYFIEVDKLWDVSIKISKSKCPPDKYKPFCLESFGLLPFFTSKKTRNILLSQGYCDPVGKKIDYLPLPNILEKVKGDIFESIGDAYFQTYFGWILSDQIIWKQDSSIDTDIDDLASESFEKFDRYARLEDTIILGIEYKNRKRDMPQSDFDKYWNRMEQLGVSHAIVLNSIAMDEQKGYHYHINHKDGKSMLVLTCLLTKKLDFEPKAFFDVQEFLRSVKTRKEEDV